MEQTYGHAIVGLSPGWKRGPARLEGEWVVLDHTRAETYSSTGPAVLFDLAAIRRPSDIVPFVRRYGLLWHRPTGAESADHTGYQEQVADWLREAINLSYQLGLWRLLQRSVAGDEDARKTLWEYSRDLRLKYTQDWPLRAPATVDELHVAISQLLTGLVNDKLKDVSTYIESGAVISRDGILGQPGHFTFAPSAPNLLTFAYFQLALLLTDRVPLESCSECGRFFQVTDRRQRYCSTACAGRARYRRWATKQREGAGSPSEREGAEGGSDNG